MSTSLAPKAVDRAALSDALRGIMRAERVICDDEELRPYECDALSAYRRRPLVVCIPDTLDEARAVLRLCGEWQVPVVARGAGTGLSGGALPPTDGVLMSLARFNKILEVDSGNRVARVQPGVRNIAITEA